MNSPTFVSGAAAGRFGVKGPRAAEWLSAQGITLPSQPNTWNQTGGAASDDGDLLVARLGASEFFLTASAIDAYSNLLLRRVSEALRAAQPGVYPVLREDAAFVLSGQGALDVLAQVCNVNFAQVALQTRPVIMTMMIGVAVLIVPQRTDGDVCYRIWCDPTFAMYLGESVSTVVSDVCGSQRRELA